MNLRFKFQKFFVRSHRESFGSSTFGVVIFDCLASISALTFEISVFNFAISALPSASADGVL